MSASRAFFSFTSIPDPADHRAYNEWHQLDHRPENLALPGVTAGERWVRTPACAAAGRAAPGFDGLHYVNMYWFADPVERTVAAWQELAERSFHWGRREDVHIAERLAMMHVRPVSGRAATRVRVGPDALPHRPNRGVHVTMTVTNEPRSGEAERRNRWWHDEYVPAQLTRPGVAGCWTFASESNFATHLDLGGTPQPSTRIVLFYLDEHPVDVAATLDPIAASTGAIGETVLLHTPLDAITPWAWDWFGTT